MTPDEHREQIIQQAVQRIDLKYRRGQAEHGGQLWTKPGIIDMAIDEATDQLVYLLTLKEQLENPEMINPQAGDN